MAVSFPADINRIRISTYNVNDKLPPDGTVGFSPVVGQGEEDILVFGFQEVGESLLPHIVCGQDYTARNGFVEYGLIHRQTYAVRPCSSPKVLLGRTSGKRRYYEV